MLQKQSQIIALFALSFALLGQGGHAQDDEARQKRHAVRAEDKTAASAKPWVPNTRADEQPDISGFWAAEVGGTYSLTNPRRGGGRLEELQRQRKGLKPILHESRIVDPSDGRIPYLPEASAKQKDLEAHIDEVTKPEYVDPQQRCLPDGPIRSTFWSEFEISQFPGYVAITYDQNHPFRLIPLDNRPRLGETLKLWMGDSRGHWEGNTLVVEVTNNNSKSRLDNEGDFASDHLTLVERYVFLDHDTLRYEATFTDATVYQRPWMIAAIIRRVHGNEPEYELWENTCHEGERDTDLTLAASGENQAQGSQK
ncbi:MAG: hypothetical protein JWQ42_2030 [Edaphobacter sp.]|nr:hypothetical protein [Edaphobacter sp.]